MARSRVISQNVAVFAGSSQITRAQSANYSFALNKEPVQVFGQLAPIDQIALEPPTVTLDFSYLAVNSENETVLGLDNGMTTILDGSQAEKHYAITISPQGQEASAADGAVGVGMGYITSYSAEGSIGAFPTASVTVEGSSMASNASGSTVQLLRVDENCAQSEVSAGGVPASLPESATSVIRPGNVTVSISGGNTGLQTEDICLQSYDISVDMSRDPVQCLGCFWPVSRELNFPITVTATIEANLGDLGDADMEGILCDDSLTTVTITLYETDCSTPTLRGGQAVSYTLRGATLTGQNVSASIGPNATVSATYTAFVGGPDDNIHGFDIS